MQYALLIRETQEYFDRRKDAAFMGAWAAYGEALRAAGVFAGGAGLLPPQTATTVSVRNGKRHVFLGEGHALADIQGMLRRQRIAWETVFIFNGFHNTGQWLLSLVKGT